MYSTDATNVQLREAMSSIEVTCRDVGEGLLSGAEVTQERCIVKAHPRMGDS